MEGRNFWIYDPQVEFSSRVAALTNERCPPRIVLILGSRQNMNILTIFVHVEISDMYLVVLVASITQSDVLCV